MDDPLLPYLIEIAMSPAARGLILCGGYGIARKQVFLREARVPTLIVGYPSARATADLDFVLRLQFLENQELREVVHTTLERLDYSPVEKALYYQFAKALPGVTERPTIKVDLHARRPEPDSRIGVKGIRVGTGVEPKLHARVLGEAFAAETTPVRIPITGKDPQGVSRECEIDTPHPFAWLHMKLAATRDWLAFQGTDKAKPDAPKHAHDVYLLVAMLTEQEFGECRRLRHMFRGDPWAAQARESIAELFGTPSSPGFVQVRLQLDGVDVDHPTFWEALNEIV